MHRLHEIRSLLILRPVSDVHVSGSQSHGGLRLPSDLPGTVAPKYKVFYSPHPFLLKQMVQRREQIVQRREQMVQRREQMVQRREQINGAEKRTNGAETRTNGAEKRTNGAEKRTNGAEKIKCTLGPPYPGCVMEVSSPGSRRLSVCLSL